MKTSSNNKSKYRPTRLTGKIIDLIKEELPIEEVVRSYTPLRKYGDKFIGNCPLCSERVSSLSVYPEFPSFYCSCCQRTGDVFYFVMEANKVSFRDSMKIIISRYAKL